MRNLLVCLVLLSGCVEVVAVAASRSALNAMQDGDRRRAERDESARVARENLEIRRTGERLRLERHPPRAPEVPRPIDPYAPERLDGATIVTVMSAVELAPCREQNATRGQVLVSANIDSDGHVTAVSVLAAPEPALGDCVADAVRATKLPATQHGGSFRYPFVL